MKKRVGLYTKMCRKKFYETFILNISLHDFSKKSYLRKPFFLKKSFCFLNPQLFELFRQTIRLIQLGRHFYNIPFILFTNSCSFCAGFSITTSRSFSRPPIKSLTAWICLLVILSTSSFLSMSKKNRFAWTEVLSHY